MDLNDGLAAYLKASRGMAASTARTMRHRVAAWERLAGSCELPTTELIEVARESGLARGLSHTTIESTIKDVCRMAGAVGHTVDRGRPLRQTVRCKPVPALEAVGKLYAVAEQCEWPSRLRRDDWTWMSLSPADRCIWLRAYLVLAVWTGLRASDLLRLDWTGITRDRIVWQASKTAKRHVFPVNGIIRYHIESLKAFNRSTVLGIGVHTKHLVRKELSRLCEMANVPPLTPQSLRRSAVTTWATVAPEAGRIVHGTGLGVLAHYYDGEQILRAAMDRFPWPNTMRPPELRDARKRDECELLAVLERLPSDRIADVIRVARAFAG